MEEQLAPSAPAPVPSSMPGITPEALEQMKARAREDAIRMVMLQRQPNQEIPGQVPSILEPPTKVVYVRRNLTVAELILTVFLACGLVFGVQAGWNFASQILPRIEVKVK